MGIRIHKCMGYGLDIQANGIDWPAAFERLDVNDRRGEVGRLMEAEYERLKALDHRDYMHFALMGPDLERAAGDTYPSTFLDVIKHASDMDSEGGWLVFIPPGMTSWHRHWDDLDYAEYHARKGEEFDYTAEIVPVKYPLYPFSGYQDATTGEEIKTRTHLLSQQPQNAVPVVPPCVRLIAEHTQVCNWRALRPVIATWWG